MREEGAVCAGEGTSTEKNRADRASGVRVVDADEAAGGRFVDGHFRDDGDAHVRADHGEETEKVAAFKNDAVEAGAVAGGDRSFAEAVSVAEKKKQCGKRDSKPYGWSYNSELQASLFGRVDRTEEEAMAEEKKKVMTTDAGRPVGDNQNSLTVGPRGPVVFEDFLLFEKMAHFNRERIPERVVHAKGSGAYGHFVCTSKEITKYATAKLFSQVGKKTPTFIRFSTVGGEKGSADTERDPRGFALKFYTEEGNWDMTGNNTPVFFIRDPLKFGDFIHTQKRDPETNLKSPTMMWDF